MTGRARELHLFYVQSEISRLVCEAIVRHEGLDDRDVLFLLDRGQVLHPGRRCEIIPENLGPCLPRTLRAVPYARAVRRRRAAYLADITDARPFHGYVNRMNQSLARAMRDAAGCRSMSVYEEGFAAYWHPIGPAFSITGVKKQRRRTYRRFLSWLAGEGDPARQSYYPGDHRHAYATSPRAFAGFDRRIEVAPDFSDGVTAARLPFPSIPPGALLVAMPSPEYFRNCSGAWARLVDTLTLLVEAAPGPVLVKAHPHRGEADAFLDPIAAEVSTRAGLDLRTVRVPDDLSLERLAVARPDVTITVAVSSLACYADRLRAPIVSLAAPIYGRDHWKVTSLREAAPGAIFVEPGTTGDELAARLASARSEARLVGSWTAAAS
jgi:hypothetical protein